jgi:hypothetical protein
MIILFLIFHHLDFLFLCFFLEVLVCAYIYLFILLRVVLLLGGILIIFDSFEETLSQLKV